MKHEHLIEFLLKKVGEILCDARGRHRKISDELAVKTIRALFSPPRAQTAFEQGNDTVQAFVIRGMNRALLNKRASKQRVYFFDLASPIRERLVTGHAEEGNNCGPAFFQKVHPLITQPLHKRIAPESFRGYPLITSTVV